VRDLARSYPMPHLSNAAEIIQRWAHDYHSGSLLKDKETSREQAFNQDFFITILGYKSKPFNPSTLEPKSSTKSGQIPDVRLCFTDLTVSSDYTFAVVELKGPSVSLDRPQKGQESLSPVQQGFKYKPQFRNCEFVIVSNFLETRLYNDNLLDFESWTLDELSNPTDDFINLRIFHFLLCAPNFTSSSGFSPTSRLLLEARSKQEAISKKFYLDYRVTRLSLVSDILTNNIRFENNPEEAIFLAQKLVDRIVFVCFAEDKGFIPDHSLARVAQEADSSAFSELWATLTSFFASIDQGSKKLGIPVGFNGGLFRYDPSLEGLVVSDAVLRKLLNLGQYDFSEDLTVTVLGHIFEQSITDLEDLRKEIGKGRLSDLNATSKRKRAGVYYTPSAVVRSIVQSSVGLFLAEIETELLKKFAVKDDLKETTFIKRQRVAFLEYQKRLQSIRVLDPACGSGAFLVAVFDFLLAENQRVASILGGDLLSSDEMIKPILQTNIFGADLSEESVEITKLSLWLKSASKGQKLTKLDDNIVCGNSLVSGMPNAINPLIWESAFQEVMDDGGFDVVLGNPPYVDSELMTKTEPLQRRFISATYPTASGNWDLYIPFYQKAFDLTKSLGICSMIIPNKVLVVDYAKGLRDYILEKGSVVAVSDLTRDSIFDVDVYPVVLTTGKFRRQGLVSVNPVGQEDSLEVRELDSAAWFRILSDSSEPHEVGRFFPLQDLFNIGAAATVSEAYQLKEIIFEDATAIGLKVINTGTIDPYCNYWGVTNMTYIKGSYKFPVGSLELQAAKKWNGRSKVIVAGMSTRIEACYSHLDEYFPAKSTVVITEKEGSNFDLFSCLAIVNSQTFSTLFSLDNSLNAMAGGYMTISQKNLAAARVPVEALDSPELLSGLGLTLNQEGRKLVEVTARLRTLLSSRYGPDCWSSAPKLWWTLEFPGFTKSLKVKLALAEQEQVLELFEKYRPLAAALARTIDETAAEVDLLIGSNNQS